MGCAENGPVVQAAVATLKQCRDLISGLNDEVYASASTRISGSSIGQHVRHNLDHFAAITADSAGGPIDYDHRDRGVDIESDRQAAIEKIDTLVQEVAGLSRCCEEPAVIRVMLSSDGLESDLQTTIGRELAFATHHAIHHHAMIKSIAEEFDSCCPESFGRAPSTVNFEQHVEG